MGAFFIAEKCKIYYTLSQVKIIRSNNPKWGWL